MHRMLRGAWPRSGPGAASRALPQGPPPYPQVVCRAYRDRGWAFLREALSSPEAPEELTGLAALQQSLAAVGPYDDDSASLPSSHSGVVVVGEEPEADPGPEEKIEDDWVEM